MDLFGKIVDGRLEYVPKDFVTEDGRIIFDFYKDSINLLLNGYKHIISEPPKYDPDTQYVELKGYKEDIAFIEVLYEVKTIENNEQKEVQMNKCLLMFAQTLTDEDASTIPLVFPIFSHPNHYKVGDKFRYEGVLYKVLTEHDTQEDWLPTNSPSLYTKVLSQQPGEDIPEWEQPGAENAYSKGDRVILDGVIYESLVDNNVWKPTDYPAGWKQIEE